MVSRRRLAVVLFNLGGPDGLEDVKPFLFNLFNDPSIIGLPGIVRTPLARLIASRREEEAQANYARMGGGSPLLPGTRSQSEALHATLARMLPGDEIRTFICMRYWNPQTPEVAAQVQAFAPDEVVLLPLYPQYSTTTTASSLKLWSQTYRGPGRSRTVCCFPQAEGWIAAQAASIAAKLVEAGDRPVRVLMSAHGIPEKLVTGKGDPYQEQIEATCAALALRLDLGPRGERWDVCYQSRVGPLKWLGPSTPDAIAKAGEDGLGVVLSPVAFVSEHIETLVELDVEYAELAHELGVAPYLRAAAVGTAPDFISALAEAVVEALPRQGVAPHGPGCRGKWKACPRTCDRKAA